MTACAHPGFQEERLVDTCAKRKTAGTFDDDQFKTAYARGKACQRSVSEEVNFDAPVSPSSD